LGFIKEYHIWDALYVDHCENFLRNPHREETAEEALLRLMQRIDGVYENYFKSLIHEDVVFTGDITPSYACLREPHFETIKRKLKGAGFSVKVVFLMRDPVERNWSSLRMKQRNISARGIKISNNELVSQFRSFYRQKKMVDRTRYDKTIAALRGTFHEGDIYYGFYENLFSEKSVRQLSDFLGLDLTDADVNERVNVSRPIPLSDAVYESCRKYFLDVYEYCYEEFPITKELWPGK